MAWGAAPFVIDAAFGGRAPTAPRRARPHAQPVTTVLRIGDVPLEVVRTTATLAARSGPTVVVVDDPTISGHVSDIDVRIVSSLEAAAAVAVEEFGSEAVLILGARCVPVSQGCAAAAARIGDGVGWVTCRSQGLGVEGLAPGVRDSLGSARRSGARRAGALLWEPNATLVATQLFEDVPREADMTLGAWLRRAAIQGHEGADVDEVVSVTWVPGTPETFWPATLRRQRVAVIDLLGAFRTGRFRGRLLALGCLLRELFAFPLLFWLALPALVCWHGSLPISLDPIWFAALLAALAAARWVTGRMLHGLALEPSRDAMDIAYAATGSLLAVLPARLNRVAVRVVARPGARPAVWAALVCAALGAATLVASHSGRRTDHLAAGLVIFNLLLLWPFAFRALAQRRWDRQLVRLPMDVAAVVDGHVVRVVDGSPRGVAVLGKLDGLALGDTVTALLEPGGDQVCAQGVVAHLARREDGRVVAGLALSMTPADQAVWEGKIVRGCTAPQQDASAADRPRSAAWSTPSTSRRHDRAVLVGVALAAVLTAPPLLLMLAGYHPLIMRSGSMVPNIAVGDVVVIEHVWALDVGPGDVVTFQDPSGEPGTVTHRVRSVDDSDGVRTFETCGDANVECESWSMVPEDTVGRAVFVVPGVGLVVVNLLRPAMLFVLAVIALCVAAFGSILPRSPTGMAVPA
jgi:signal peptidase